MKLHIAIAALLFAAIGHAGAQAPLNDLTPCSAAVRAFASKTHWTARAPALQVQAAASPNVDEAREVTLHGGRHWRGGARGAEAEGKPLEDGDGEGRRRTTKLQKRTHD